LLLAEERRRHVRDGADGAGHAKVHVEAASGQVDGHVEPVLV